MAQINIHIDDDVKSSAEKTLDNIGLSLSAAINVFLKTVARENRIPFELSAGSFYNADNIEYLEGILQDIKNGSAHFAEHDLIEVD